jgi:hypothetical protein
MSPTPQARKRTRQLSVLAVAACAVTCIALVVAAVVLTKFSTNNCDRIHAIVKVGGEVMADGRADLSAYRKEGLLSDEQYDRAIKKLDKRLERWYSADCPPPTVPQSPLP